ncbi:ubiquitin-40S ribosomal protein S27a-like [Tripterygium wilfordii]|uniref:Ubiquitin-40S ribosomal protein S27a-like n=1 Tax=Tripterygium wilfordii TaxID=458696 RepID=A0A7J7CDV0_TRIWF|nr:ubiquitin-40S ribosomal protein S27a-like [Tripterygium wilfordii]
MFVCLTANVTVSGLGLGLGQVDDSGKVQRLRKECPNAECGAGTFMANHFDRHYCGKCGLTYVYQKAGGD